MDKAGRVTSSLRQSSSETNEESEEYREEDEEDDDISVIAVIQADKDASKKRSRPNESNVTKTVQDPSRLTYKQKPEVILLEQQPAERRFQAEGTYEAYGNRRAVDLGDKKTKTALHGQKRPDSSSVTRSDDEGASADYGSMEMLQKLPSDTVVIKQDSAKSRKEDSDYVRDSTETNSSGGSSSTSGYAAGKVKRIHRVVRSKNRNTVEVRRNPMRVTKKDTDKDATRSRQRLLSTKRREAQMAPEPKRAKHSTMPYMNTRSVTRKMYTVGAIYQAPTINDTKEWKEWPVHGMHERPVFHPQVGLATEYMGRYFISLDGMSYREIIDYPNPKAIASDPYWNHSCPNQERQERCTKSKAQKPASNEREDKSFAGYMHRSLHYVLAYCAQVMTPAYRRNVKDKIKILQRDGILPSTTVSREDERSIFTETSDSGGKRTQDGKNVKNTIDVEQKRAQDRKQLETYTVAMPRNTKAPNQYERIIRQPHTSTLYLADTQKNLITLKNVRTLHGGQLIFQDVVPPIQKNSLIFVKAASVQTPTREQVYKAIPRDLSFAKLEGPTVNDENLTETSSMYANIVPTANSVPTHSSSPVGNFRRVPPKLASKPENFAIPKRVAVDRSLSYDRKEKERENDSRVANYDIKGFGKGNEASASTSGVGTTWYTNDASEIAKILSEYNRSIARKSAVQNLTFHASPTAVHKSNLQRANQGLTRADLRSGNSEAQCYRQNYGHGSQTAIKLSQDKWRRFYPTVEIVNGSHVSYKVDAQGASMSSENRPADVRSDFQEITARHGNVDDDVCVGPGDSRRKEKSSESNPEKKEDASQEYSEKSVEVDVLQELLENTAMLYCAATGTHQDDLATYIDSLDAKQSVQWLEMMDSTCS